MKPREGDTFLGKFNGVLCDEYKFQRDEMTFYVKRSELEVTGSIERYMDLIKQDLNAVCVKNNLIRYVRIK